MDWLNIHRSTLSAEQFLGCDPVQRATWLCLMAFCADQENGGRIEGASEWGDRKWQQVVRVTRDEAHDVCPLWTWIDGVLVVWAYPVEKEEEVKRNRSNGKAGGRPPKPKQNHLVISGLSETEPSGSFPPKRKGIGIGIGIGKEGEKEEDHDAVDLFDGAKNNKATRFTPPTEDQWAEYCLQTWEGWPEAKIRESHAYYQSVGWMVGKSKIKDWKATARTAFGKAQQWGHLQPFGSANRKQQQPQRAGLPTC